MSYSLITLWHEKNRFLPGVLAVAFSALLIACQCGLLLGLFSITSIPIDRTQADVWVSAPKVLSVDLGRPIRLLLAVHGAGVPAPGWHRHDDVHAGQVPRPVAGAGTGPPAGRVGPDHGVHRRRVLAALPDALADQDQGGHRPGLRGGAG